VASWRTSFRRICQSARPARCAEARSTAKLCLCGPCVKRFKRFSCRSHGARGWGFRRSGNDGPSPTTQVCGAPTNRVRGRRRMGVRPPWQEKTLAPPGPTRRGFFTPGQPAKRFEAKRTSSRVRTDLTRLSDDVGKWAVSPLLSWTLAAPRACGGCPNARRNAQRVGREMKEVGHARRPTCSQSNANG
jgi:hypothetical protein